MITKEEKSDKLDLDFMIKKELEKLIYYPKKDF